MVNVRHDKAWSDCMTLLDLEALKATNDGKLAKRHYQNNEQEEEVENSSKRRKITTKAVTVIDPIYRPVSGLAEIKAVSKALIEKVIVVEPCRLHSALKAKIEKAIVENGGIVEQNVLKGHTWAFIQTGDTIKAKNVVRSEVCNVIKSDWLSEGRFRPLRPSDMVFATPETEEALKANYDLFGDSFGLRASLDSLKYSMDQVKAKGQAQALTYEEMADFELEHNMTEFGLFRPLTAVFESGLELAKLAFEFYGGRVLQNIEDPGLAYYVVSGPEVDLSHVKAMRRPLQGQKFKIVNVEWVERCVEGGEMLCDTDFML